MRKRFETQGHVLAACTAIHNDAINEIEKYELFSENPEDLKLIYQKLTTTMETLEMCSSGNKSVEQPGISGYTVVVVMVLVVTVAVAVATVVVVYGIGFWLDSRYLDKSCAAYIHRTVEIKVTPWSRMIKTTVTSG